MIDRGAACVFAIMALAVIGIGLVIVATALRSAGLIP